MAAYSVKKQNKQNQPTNQRTNKHNNLNMTARFENNSYPAM